MIYDKDEKLFVEPSFDSGDYTGCFTITHKDIPKTYNDKLFFDLLSINIVSAIYKTIKEMEEIK